MAYALGYDKSDFASDDEGDKGTGSSPRRPYRKRQQPPIKVPTASEMDKMDTATLEGLGWMEPLGYRTLSKISGLSPSRLRRHFWASRLRRRSPLSADINYYFTNSHSPGHQVQLKIKKIIELKRFNENNSDYKDPNVRLLWHGTSVENVAGILTNGFQLPMHSGMFGRGVYFADRVTKSAQYCHIRGGADGVLFLCAVNLGKMYKTSSGMNNLTRAPNGFDSVMGCGKHVPDKRDVTFHRGARIPCGVTVTRRGSDGSGLHHNEFIVYDLSKIAILFLVLVEQT